MYRHSWLSYRSVFAPLSLSFPNTVDKLDIAKTKLWHKQTQELLNYAGQLYVITASTFKLYQATGVPVNLICQKSMLYKYSIGYWPSAYVEGLYVGVQSVPKVHMHFKQRILVPRTIVIAIYLSSLQRNLIRPLSLLLQIMPIENANSNTALTRTGNVLPDYYRREGATPETTITRVPSPTKLLQIGLGTNGTARALCQTIFILRRRFRVGRGHRLAGLQRRQRVLLQGRPRNRQRQRIL